MVFDICVNENLFAFNDGVISVNYINSFFKFCFMDKLHSFLLEWAVNYVKNRDLLTKSIRSIEKNKEGFLVNFKDKKQFFIVEPFIQNINEVMEKMHEEEHFSLVVFNTKDNLEAVVDSWNRLIEFKKLSIYFVNPFSQLDKKWIVCPYTHHKVGSESSLELGLKTMFEMVGSLSKEELSKKISQHQ